MKDSKQPASIKLVSLNVEGSCHLGRVLPYLARELPDVAAIQELSEQDAPRFREALGGASCLYAPMGDQLRDGVSSAFGIGVFSRLPVKKQDIRYYVGGPDNIRKSDHEKPETFNACNRAVAVCDVEKEASLFRIATTHFTWSKDGKPSDSQREHMKKLLAILESSGEFVLTGDFNSPRGGEIFAMLASKYKDNIPPHYATSIDGGLHRAGQLNLMVDGLFSTPAYAVSDVRMVSGLSDHCAIASTVSKQAA